MPHRASEIQLFYAKVLDVLTKTGFLFLVLSFLLYVSGILTPFIPKDKLPEYWSLSVREYLKVTGIHPGWDWLHHLNHGDFFAFLGLSFMAGVTIVCFCSVVGKFFKKKETLLGMIAAVEVLVLLLAASGLLQVGGH
jgi:hypothetical protein